MYTESLRLMYNTVIESSPLLLAIKQGSVDEVRSLLQQLPREEAMTLIINGPDVIPFYSPNRVTDYKEKLVDSLRNNYTLTDGYLNYCFSVSASYFFWEGIFLTILWSFFRGSINGLLLAVTAAKDSNALIMLLLDFITETDIRNMVYFIGDIIASRNSAQDVAMTQILLELTPQDMKQLACVNWLTCCVSGGVCGVEVISLILKSLKWNDKVKNVIIGLLINPWDIGMNEDVFK